MSAQPALRLCLTLALAFLAAHPLAAQTVDPAGPDTVVYTSSRGVVTFLHKKHAEQSECSACHHESRPEKPLESEQQKCGDCHTESPAAPIKTSLRNAYHDTEAREGTCYTCHKAKAAEGATAPTRCVDCHVRAATGPQR